MQLREKIKECFNCVKKNPIHCKLVVFEKVVCNYAVLKNYIANSVLKVLMFESISLPLKL